MKKNEKSRKKQPAPETLGKVDRVISEAINMDSRFDPAGSYTGRPLEPGETPVQDADDL
jgi:hypothetical protein